MGVQDKIGEAIDNISQKILKYNENRKLFQDLFRKVKKSLNPSDFPEPFGITTTDITFTKEVQDANVDGLKIAGVDGGVIHKSLNFFDIALIRAVGVLFLHQKETKPIVRYFPEEQPFPDILTSIEPLSMNEIETLISIWRMQKEIRCGISLIEEDQPDLIILDGSVLPVVELRQVMQSEFLSNQYKNLKTRGRQPEN